MGNIPLDWYEDYPHLGYDLGGQRITKPLKRDEVGLVSLQWKSPVAVSLVPAGGVPGQHGGPRLLEDCEGQADGEGGGAHGRADEPSAAPAELPLPRGPL